MLSYSNGTPLQKSSSQQTKETKLSNEMVAAGYKTFYTFKLKRSNLNQRGCATELRFHPFRTELSQSQSGVIGVDYQESSPHLQYSLTWVLHRHMLFLLPALSANFFKTHKRDANPSGYWDYMDGIII